jgi:hypothetical protein
MNHYDPFIQDFLSQYRSVSFEKIGHITIGNAQGVNESPVIFQYDKKAANTPELIKFVAEKTGKNKFLIESDLESYFELTRQFINIGKAYELEGLGFISLSKSGEYTFTPYEREGKEEQKASKKKHHNTYTTTQVEQKGTSRRFLMFVAFLIIVGVLGVIGWGTYKLFIEKGVNNTNDTIATSNTAIMPDTTATLPDTTASLKDTSLNKDTTNVAGSDTANIINHDSASYKFIFERTYSLDRANNRIDELKIILSKDASYDSTHSDSSTVYRLFLKLKLPVADTAKMKDSLQRYFQHSIKIVPL